MGERAIGFSVIADDGCACQAIDDAVTELSRDGTLDGVALFVTFDEFDSVSTWRDLGLRLGIHLNLSSGHPVSEPALVPSLVSPDTGLFVDPLQFGGGSASDRVNTYVRQLGARVSRQDVAREFEAQVQRFRHVVGGDPMFVSVHHDLDVNPTICEAADALGFGPCRQSALERGDLAAYEYTLHDFDVSEDTVATWLLTLAADLDRWPAAVICHPATSTDRLDCFTMYTGQRVAEYRALKRGDVRGALAAARERAASET